MGWLEGFGAAIVGGIRKLIVAVILLIVLVALIHWARNNSGQAQATSDKVMGAVASGIGWAADGVTGMTGGQAAEAGGPGDTGAEVIYVQNTAPLRWHVGGAIAIWNKGLTSVQLRAGDCRDGAQCIKVSQVSDLPDQDGHLVLGRTSRFFGTSIKFNGAAVGQVPARDQAHEFAVAACHELGHALGLEHRTSTKTCMNATVTAGVSTRPDAQDYAAVNAEHGH